MLTGACTEEFEVWLMTGAAAAGGVRDQGQLCFTVHILQHNKGILRHGNQRGFVPGQRQRRGIKKLLCVLQKAFSVSSASDVSRSMEKEMPFSDISISR